MHICEHVKDEFPLLSAGDNKVFLILILIWVNVLISVIMIREENKGRKKKPSVVKLLWLTIEFYK